MTTASAQQQQSSQHQQQQFTSVRVRVAEWSAKASTVSSSSSSSPQRPASPVAAAEKQQQRTAQQQQPLLASSLSSSWTEEKLIARFKQIDETVCRKWSNRIAWLLSSGAGAAAEAQAQNGNTASFSFQFDWNSFKSRLFDPYIRDRKFDIIEQIFDELQLLERACDALDAADRPSASAAILAPNAAATAATAAPGSPQPHARSDSDASKRKHSRRNSKAPKLLEADLQAAAQQTPVPTQRILVVPQTPLVQMVKKFHDSWIQPQKSLFSNDIVMCRCRHEFAKNYMKRYVISYNTGISLFNLEGEWNENDGTITELCSMSLEALNPFSTTKTLRWTVRDATKAIEEESILFQRVLVRGHLLAQYSSVVRQMLVIDKPAGFSIELAPNFESDRSLLLACSLNHSQLVLFRIASAIEEIVTYESDELVSEISRGLDRIVLEAAVPATTETGGNGKTFSIDREAKTLTITLLSPDSVIAAGQQDKILEKCFFTISQYVQMIKYAGLYIASFQAAASAALTGQHMRPFGIELLSTAAQLDRTIIDLDFYFGLYSTLSLWTPSAEESKAFADVMQHIQTLAENSSSTDASSSPSSSPSSPAGASSSQQLAVERNERVLRCWHVILYTQANLALERVLVLTNRAYYVVNYDFSAGSAGNQKFSEIKRHALQEIYVVEANDGLLAVFTHEQRRDAHHHHQSSSGSSGFASLFSRQRKGSSAKKSNLRVSSTGSSSGSASSAGTPSSPAPAAAAAAAAAASPAPTWSAVAAGSSPASRKNQAASDSILSLSRSLSDENECKQAQAFFQRALAAATQKPQKMDRAERERPSTQDNYCEYYTSFDSSKSREILYDMAWSLYAAARHQLQQSSQVLEPFLARQGLARPKGDVSSFIHNKLKLGMTSSAPQSKQGAKESTPPEEIWTETRNPLFVDANERAHSGHNSMEIVSMEQETSSLEQQLLSLSSNHDLNMKKAAKYKVQMRIGGGNEGSIFLALDREAHQKVAIKGMSYNDKNRARADRELSVMLQLSQHRNIIRHLDHFVVTSESLFGQEQEMMVVMEYCHRSLEDVVREHAAKGTKPSFVAVSRWLLQLCQGVAFMHSKNITHRDIKPDNTLFLTTVDDEGNVIRTEEDYQVKICDFGSATTLRSAVQRRASTVAGRSSAAAAAEAESSQHKEMMVSVVGTPLFMAPEIVMNKAYDSSADMYSLGVLALELLLCRPAAQMPNVFQCLTRDLNFIKKLCDEHKIDKKLSEIAVQCCRFNASERPTAEKLVEYLYEVLPSGTLPVPRK